MTLANILVLIIEQNAEISDRLRQALRSEGISTLTVSSELEALMLLRRLRPCLVLLGSLPDQGSFRIVRTIRTDANCAHIPLTMVSTGTSDEAIVRALDAGADDYLHFPCSGLHLGARIRALLRRTGSRPHEPVVRFASIEIFPDSHMVYVGGAAIEISPYGYGLLNLFVAHPGRTFSREGIRALLGNERAGELRVVDMQVLRLRAALGEAKTLIKTVRHQGYRLVAA